MRPICSLMVMYDQPRASTPSGGIFYLQLLASPYPRLPALWRQDTTFTWRLADAVITLTFVITQLSKLHLKHSRYEEIELTRKCRTTETSKLQLTRKCRMTEMSKLQFTQKCHSILQGKPEGRRADGRKTEETEREGNEHQINNSVGETPCECSVLAP